MAGLLLCIASVLSVASAAPSPAPVIVGQTFMAGSQDPTGGSVPWSLVSHGIAEKLFTVDKTGNVVPQMAQSVTKVDAYTWTVALASGKKFSDGQAVLAEHIVTALTTQNTENSNGNDALGTMNVTKVDDSTIQIVSTIAHPAMDAALANWVFVIFLKSGGNYVYSGPYMVETSTADQIELVPNTHYTDGPTVPVTIKKYSNGDALVDALKAGQVDLAFHLPISKLTEARAVEGVTVKSFEVGYQYMMFHNMRSTSPLMELKVRQAVDKAIDRKALRQALAGGHETRSLFPEDSPYHRTDSEDLHAQTSAAGSLLDQAGWVLDSGKRKKGGAELSLSLYSYPFRPGLGIMGPLIKSSLESLGITVTYADVDLWAAPHDSILSGNTYDLLMWAQHTLPNGDPQWFLNAFFRGDPMDSRNYAGINSTTVDGYLDALGYAGHAGNARITAALAAHNEILAEVAVSNLVTPEWHVGMSERLADYDPWGADYYVIRSDFTAADATPTPTDDEASGTCHAAVLGRLLAAGLLSLAAA